MDKVAALAFIGGAGALALILKGGMMNDNTPQGSTWSNPDQVPTAPSAEVLTLARTLYGEARGEGAQGMQAVANVIMNRVAHPTWWGNTVESVCLKPYQFSCWNANDPNRSKIAALQPGANAVFDTALSIAARAVAGTLPDLTGGATHYHTVNTSPNWAPSLAYQGVIGAHAFYS